MNGKLMKNVYYNINGSLNNYTLYLKKGNLNKLSSFTSDLDYKINSTTKLNLNFNYTNQKGDVQNYNLISGRTEIQKRINQLELSLEINYFKRSFLQSDIAQHYFSSRIRLIRYF